VTYAYDPRGLVSTITDPAGRPVTITYDAAGKPLDTTLLNVAIIKQRYDALGRLQSVQNHKVAGDVAIADYTVGGYDLNGRITSVTQTDGGIHPAATTAYTYDTLGRLETWTDSGNVLHRYSFDLESNRTKQVDGPTTTHQYTYAGDATSRLLTVDTTNAYSYDPAGTGDVVGRPADGSRPAQTLTWDSSGSLATVTAADSSSVTFSRDALGRVRERVQRDGTPTHAITADTVYRFSGDGDSPSYEVDQHSGGAKKSFLDGAAVVYAGDRTGTPTFLFSDVHGNTVATADQNGTAMGTIATYDPVGAPVTANGSNPTSFGFVGKFEKYSDPFASLVLMGARPYDPALGRFLAVDPVPGGSANDYDFVNQDPINGYDLNGQAPWDHWSCDWCGHAVHVVSHAAKATASWTWDHQDAILTVAAFIPVVGEVGDVLLAARAARMAIGAIRGGGLAEKIVGGARLGVRGPVFGRAALRNGSKSLFNRGPVRLGWGWNAKVGRNVFRLGIGKARGRHVDFF
jgi:RHS repeat-associated protein